LGGQYGVTPQQTPPPPPPPHTHTHTTRTAYIITSRYNESGAGSQGPWLPYGIEYMDPFDANGDLLPLLKPGQPLPKGEVRYERHFVVLVFIVWLTALSRSHHSHTHAAYLAAPMPLVGPRLRCLKTISYSCENSFDTLMLIGWLSISILSITPT
jgi:hypothetical protein